MRHLLGLAILLGGCEAAPPAPSPTPSATAPAAPPPAAPKAAVPCTGLHHRLKPRSSIGAPMQLADLDGQPVAVVADADEHALRVVGLDGAVLHQLDLGEEPSHVLVLGDGRALVTMPFTHEVRALDLGPEGWQERCRVQVASEPRGLATDGPHLVVASRWAATVSVLAAETLALERSVPVGRDPYAVAFDGDTALVTHVVGGRLTRVPLADAPPTVVPLQRQDTKRTFSSPPKESWPRGPTQFFERDAVPTTRRATQSFAIAPFPEGFLIPSSLTDPSRPPGRVLGYGGGTEDIHPHVGATVVLRGDEVLVPRERRERSVACTLPRGVAYDPRDRMVWVSCLESNRVVATWVPGGQEPHPIAARFMSRAVRYAFTVDGGPGAIAIDEATRRLVIWSPHTRALSVTALPDPAFFVSGAERTPDAVHALPRGRRLPALVEEGRRLFHSGWLTVSKDQRACASCHPSGRDDGVTWTTPDGPRQTPILAGRLEGTAPYGWNGRNDLDGHLRRTVRRLGGLGLKPGERKALVAYLTSIRTPTTPSTDVARGRALFASAEMACASCHPLDGHTSDGRRHDLGILHVDDRLRAFDTPSLRHVAHSAPYFHDGRSPTLTALLADPSHGMGGAANLSDADRGALEAFLRTL